MSQHAHHSKRWSLNDLISVASGPEMEAVFDGLEEAVARLEQRRAALAPSMAEGDFAGILSLVERVVYFTQKLNGFATLWLAEETSDQAALAFRGRVNETLAAARNRVLFFELWY